MDRQKEVISMIKSCINLRKGGMPMKDLEREFHDLVGSNIPYKMLGHASLKEFLQSIPEVYSSGTNAQGDFVLHVKDEKLQHIQEMVSQQKGPKKKINKKNCPGSYSQPNFYSEHKKNTGYANSKPRYQKQGYNNYQSVSSSSYQKSNNYENTSARKPFAQNTKNYNSYYSSQKESHESSLYDRNAASALLSSQNTNTRKECEPYAYKENKFEEEQVSTSEMEKQNMADLSSVEATLLMQSKLQYLKINTTHSSDIKLQTTTQSYEAGFSLQPLSVTQDPPALKKEDIMSIAKCISALSIDLMCVSSVSVPPSHLPPPPLDWVLQQVEGSSQMPPEHEQMPPPIMQSLQQTMHPTKQGAEASLLSFEPYSLMQRRCKDKSPQLDNANSCPADGANNGTIGVSSVSVPPSHLPPPPLDWVLQQVEGSSQMPPEQVQIPPPIMQSLQQTMHPTKQGAEASLLSFEPYSLMQRRCKDKSPQLDNANSCPADGANNGTVAGPTNDSVVDPTKALELGLSWQAPLHEQQSPKKVTKRKSRLAIKFDVDFL